MPMKKKSFNEVLDFGLHQEVQLKATRDVRHTMIVTGGITIGIFICYWALKKAFTPPYLDLYFFSLALIVAIITLSFFISLINFKQLFFTPTKVIIKTNFFGKKYEYDIIGFGYREGKETQREKEEDKIAVLFSKGNYEIINSSSIYNFHQVRLFLSKNYQNIGDKAFKKRDQLNFQKYLALFLIGSILFLGHFLIKGFEKDRLHTFEDSLTFINITLKNLNGENAGDNSDSPSYSLSSVEYPDFEFLIEGASFDVCNTQLDKNFNRGNIFRIGIKQAVYHAKLIKDIPPNFWIKHFDWKNINIYHLEHQGEKIIDKSEVKIILENTTYYSSLVIGLVLFLFFSLGLFYYYTLSDYR